MTEQGLTGHSNPCPTCGERPFQQCRSVSKGRRTDTHAARLRGEWPAPDTCMSLTGWPCPGRPKAAHPHCACACHHVTHAEAGESRG